MKFTLCCSGSKGNSFVFEENDCRLVIDCGSTKKYLLESYREIGLNINEVDACLVTHHHSDHISQIKIFEDCDIYSAVHIEGIKKFHLLKPSDYFTIKGVKITPIPLSHDAEKTMGFILETSKEKLVYITDTGYINTSYISLLYDADYIILESNHDIEMLMKTKRPHFLKSRIYSDSGHLCNEDCAATLAAIVTQRTKQIFLAHISQEANTQQKALEVSVEELMKKKNELNPSLVICAAGQYEIIRGGQGYEETISSCACCVIGME